MGNKICIIKTDHLGDVIWSIPFVEQLASQAMDSEIHYCCLEACREIPQRLPAVSRVWVYEPQADSASRGEVLLGLRREKFDTAVVLGPVDKMNYLAFCTGAKRRVGYYYRGNPVHYLKNLLYLSAKYPHPADVAEKDAKAIPHEVEAMLELLPRLDLRIPAEKNITFPLTGPEADFARSWRESRGIGKEERVIGLHLSQKAVPHGWDPERFAGLAAALRERFPSSRWVLTYGPQEKEIFTDFFSGLKDFYPAGDLSLGQLGALLAGFSLYLSWDTGVVHLAGGVGTPVVDVFPPQNFDYCLKRWGPWGDKHAAVKQEGAALDAKTIEKILASAEKLLSDEK